MSQTTPPHSSTSSSPPPSTSKRHESPTSHRRRRSFPSNLSSLIHWLQVKKYQYEVTFSLYMLTPTEKFIFNLILFILISMLVAAASMYLPNHVAVMYRRIWYYVDGEIAGGRAKMVVGEGGGLGSGLDSATAPVGFGDGGGDLGATGREL